MVHEPLVCTKRNHHHHQSNNTIAITITNFDYLSEILILYPYDAWLNSTKFIFLSKTLNEIEIFLRIFDYRICWLDLFRKVNCKLKVRERTPSSRTYTQHAII